METLSTPDLTTTPAASYGELVDFWNRGKEKLEAQISALNLEIADERLANKTLVTRITNLQSYIDSMIEGLMDMVTFGKIDKDVAQELAEYFGRDLVHTVTVRLTVDIDAEVTVPVGYDLDDLHGDLEVEVTPAYSADVQIDSFETHGIQVEEM